MQIVVTLESDTEEIDRIMWYCWQHEQHGIYFSTGRHIVLNGEYWMWRIDCEPSKYVDVLLLRWSRYLTVL